MRLVVLIIFLIECWQMELILRGKQWKYWWQQFSKKQKRCASLHWSFFLLNGHRWSSFWGVNNRTTNDKNLIKKKCASLHWSLSQMELISKGKHPKYWWRKLSKKTKTLRLVALIIFLIEWRQMELISRGENMEKWCPDPPGTPPRNPPPLGSAVWEARLLRLNHLFPSRLRLVLVSWIRYI